MLQPIFSPENFRSLKRKTLRIREIAILRILNVEKKGFLTLVKNPLYIYFETERILGLFSKPNFRKIAILRILKCLEILYHSIFGDFLHKESNNLSIAYMIQQFLQIVNKFSFFTEV